MNAWSRRWCAYALAAVLVAIVWAGSGTAQTKDPMNGTWKLDPAKSTFNPAPGPKSLTAIIASAGTGRKVSVDGVAGDGTACDKFVFCVESEFVVVES